MGASVTFVSPDRGWLLCSGQPSAGNQGKAVYTSRDGGHRWHVVADAGFLSFSRPKTHGLCSCGYAGGISFSATGRGLLWQHRGWSYLTVNGGRDWRSLPITSAEIVEGDDGSFVSDALGFLLLHNNRNDRKRTEDLMRTNDGGRSWRVVRRWRS